MKTRRHFGRLAGMGLILMLSGVGCTERITIRPVHPDGEERRFKTIATKSVSLDQTGHVTLPDGRSFRLAGIRVRSVVETQEPTALADVNRLLSRFGKPLELQQAEGSDSVMVYYQQRHWKWDDYMGIINLFGPYYQQMRLNELLIALGLAEFDGSAGVITTSDAADLQLRQTDYRLSIRRRANSAVARNKGSNEIAVEEVDSVEHVCWDGGIYHSPKKKLRCRIAPGDRKLVVNAMKPIASK